MTAPFCLLFSSSIQSSPTSTRGNFTSVTCQRSAESIDSPLNHTSTKRKRIGGFLSQTRLLPGLISALKVSSSPGTFLTHFFAPPLPLEVLHSTRLFPLLAPLTFIVIVLQHCSRSLLILTLIVRSGFRAIEKKLTGST